MGSCEIKMCQDPVGSGTVRKSCARVADIATSIITGSAFPGQHKAVFHEGPRNLVVSVEQTADRDVNRGDCGEPDHPCRF